MAEKSDVTVIDALPYVDTAYSLPGMKEQVDRLIHEEMKQFKPSSDYLARFPPPPQLTFMVDLLGLLYSTNTLQGSEILLAEMERMEKRQPMPQMDVQRFALDPPAAGSKAPVGIYLLCIILMC